MGDNESRNRQRKNCNRNRNNKRWQNLRFEKICKMQSKGCRIGKQKITHQLKLDQWSVCGTPKVLEFDSMSIKPRKEIDDNGNKSFHNEKLLEQRAKIILSKEGAINWIDKGLFTVQSQTGIGRYKVIWNGNKWICNCPDYTKHNKDCKHVLAVQFFLMGYITIHGEETKETKIQYPQPWSQYNQAQMEEHDLFGFLLSELIKSVDEPEQYMGRPRLKLRDLIYCCIMKTYNKLPSRKTHHLFQDAMQKKYISYAPHSNAIPKTLLRPEISPDLYELVHLSSLPLAEIENNFAVDSSGFRCSSFGAYCEHAHGTRRTHNWLKVHICTGVKSNIITDVIITDEYKADSPQLKKLLLNTSKYFNIDEVSADLAYSSRKNLEIIDKLGGTPYIPFKKNATGKARGSALWKKTFHYFQLHREEFDKSYHQRSNVESTFHSIKSKLGENIQSRNRIAQENEMLCKIISYNLRVVINSIFKLGITPAFFNAVDIKEITPVIKSSKVIN
jgi:transposase